MGCGGTRTLYDERLVQPLKQSLNLSKINFSTAVHTQTIISSIVKLRDRMLTIYHKIIYKTGACCFVTPSIIHCLHCAFYKVSFEFGGVLEKSGLTYIEDPPYLQMNQELISKETQDILNCVFDFITEIRGYKALIKQIDKDTPELIYLISENKQSITSENEKSINIAIEMFNQIIKFRQDILKLYRNEVYKYVTKTESYCKEINVVAKEAIKRGISDIYKITMLFKEVADENLRKDPQNAMKSSDIQAKREILDIIKRNEEIYKSSEPEDDNNTKY